MAIIVNNPENLPVNFIIGELTKFQQVGLTGEFFKELLGHPKNGMGKITNTYFIIGTTVMLKSSKVKELLSLSKICEACALRGYKFILIKK